jgi:uncharacterized membrane protein HdeD (DUF308 family)
MNTEVDTMDIFKLPDFGKYSLIAGILLILLGTVGIVLPEFMSLEATILLASLLLVGGAFWLLHSFKARSKQWTEWLKPVLLLVTGGLMIFYPMTGIATIGLLMAVYLLIDSYGSFMMAYSIKHKKGWLWMAFNGVVSLLLAILFLAGWPATSIWLVGLYISISLFFDGWALLTISWMQHKQAQN